MSDEPQKPTSLRLWLARYRPDRVKCTLKNGDVRELQKPTTNRGQWANLEHAIMQLAPTYLEAMIGETCVAARPGVEVEDDEAQALAPVVAEDPMALMVQQLPTIVQLIVDAGDAAAARQRESYEVAFREQTQLVKILADLNAKLVGTWHKMLLDKAAQAAPEENDGAALSLLGQVLQHQSGKANGVAKPEDPHD